MKGWFLGLVAATVAAQAQAAIITEQYNFTLPTASGIYSAGHTFQITATYDNAGTVMNVWGDGANGSAEFGAGDDTLGFTYTAAGYPAFSLLSNATIAIAGLQLPGGAILADVFPTNEARVYDYGDPETTGSHVIELRQDNLYVSLAIYGPDIAYSPGGLSNFFLAQYYTVPPENGNSQQLTTAGTIYRSIRPTNRASVPEPSALALVGLGLAGLGLARRRNRQESMV